MGHDATHCHENIKKFLSRFLSYLGQCV